MANKLLISNLNPLLFFEVGRSNISKYFTRFMEKWMFQERFLDWQDQSSFAQVWQTTDIVRLQVESSFDPLVVRLQDCDGNTIFDTPMISKGVNKFEDGTYIYECEIALSGVATGCYSFLLIAGPTGAFQKTYITPCCFISADQIRNSVLMEYNSTKQFHGNVIFATGIQFQYRTMGHFGFLDIANTNVYSRDQKWNNTLLSSNAADQYPFFTGDEYGIPDDHYKLINGIWSCDNVLLDGKPFGVADGSKVDVLTIDDSIYPKRGFKWTVEAGINRNARLFYVDVDTTKKLLVASVMDSKFFGDLSNSGSSNAVKVPNVE